MPGGPPRGVAWRGRILVIPYVLTLPLLAAVALMTASALQGLDDHRRGGPEGDG